MASKSHEHGVHFERATPESQGIDSAAIASLVRAFDEQNLGVHSLMVLRHGKVVAESWWRPYQPDRRHIMFSISKSFTSTAIGLAEAEGLLSVDDNILDFFPSRANASARRNMAGVKVRHLLAMASGHESDTVGVLRALPESDWVELFLQIPLAFPPGSTFVYNSGASFVLGAIIAARTGMSVRDYLVPRIFEPLGMETPDWANNERGLNLGWTGLRLYTEDLAKLGQLYLQRGRWDGHQLLTEDWVDKATAFQVSNAAPGMSEDWSQGYGFQFWRSRHNSFRADGAFGQFSLILPEQDVVVAITAGTDRGPEIPVAVWTHLLPGIGEVTPHVVATDLATVLHSTQLPLPAYLERDPSAAASGVQCAASLNPFSIERLSFTFSASTIKLALTFRDGSKTSIRAGRTDWISGHSALMQYEEIDGADTATIGGWLDENTLELREQCIDTPFARVWTAVFGADGIARIAVQLDPGPWIGRVDRFTATPV